jgi:hypothetical protein
VLVTTRSAISTQITGPAAAGPNSATNSGTPMKPVLGMGATSAPKAASRSGTAVERVNFTVSATTGAAHNRYTASSVGLSICSTGVPAPKRNSMPGSAK